METMTIPIEFDNNGKHYNGWAIPSAQSYDDGSAKSFQVTLNKTFFGVLSIDYGKWIAADTSDSDLVASVGQCLDKIVRPEA